MFLLHWLRSCIVFQEDAEEYWKHHLFTLLLAFIQLRWEFRIFLFPCIMAKRRKLTEEDISVVRTIRRWMQRDSGTAASDDGGEIECLRETADCESSEDVLDKFSQTQESASKWYFYGVQKGNVYSLLVSQWEGLHHARTRTVLFWFLKKLMWQHSFIFYNVWPRTLVVHKISGRLQKKVCVQRWLEGNRWCNNEKHR